MKIIANQGVTAPVGFRAGGLACGLKASGKRDLGLLFSEKPAAAAGAFTANQVAAAPVVVSKKNLGRTAQAIIINSGNANACTGQKGISDAWAMVEAAAGRLGLRADKVLVASTGIIGRRLALEKVEQGVVDMQLDRGPEADHDFAQAIMTTDAFSKQLAVEIELQGTPVRIGGAAKGAGMIAPNLAPHATMIAVITTDAPLASTDLRRCLTAAVDKSFNVITVDGDTSTNDTVFALANGMARRFKLSPADEKSFQEALDFVCIQLAKMIVRDGEGATKLISYKVVGAKKESDAVVAAKTMANSILVKTAFFGEDPNWGRILAAVGRSGVELDPDEIDIDINGVAVVRSGQASGFDLTALRREMKNEEIQVWINLNQGSYQATAYGCDLNYDYVKLNAEYTT